LVKKLLSIIFVYLLVGCGGSGEQQEADVGSPLDVAILEDNASLLDEGAAADTNEEDPGSPGEDTVPPEEDSIAPAEDLVTQPDIPVDPLAACAEELIPALDWFPPQEVESFAGLIEFGQTHVTKSVEDRIAPPVTAERETLLLFSPDTTLSEDTDMRVAAFVNEELLGVVRMNPPTMLPQSLEQGLTDTLLDPYSTEAWSATLPWHWVKNGVTLRIGALEEETQRMAVHQLNDLGSPHRFTLTRTHMVLFGEEDFEVVPPHTPTKIAVDMSAWVPGAEFRWVNTSPWRLGSMVVNTAEGPRWAHSESERTSITSDGTRWNIIKHQGALRLSLANTGRGLRMTLPHEGDSSPYSFGTFMLQGWVHNGGGNYSDINNAGLAAGWTGWSGMWLNECGNGFIHEVGHSFTLAHFNGNASVNWGIADEYPNNGVNLSTHPWGYDTVRRNFRTWYRVNGNGPALEGDGETFVGKRDPMNGGESPNGITCFPQYTAYQMRKSQAWLQNSPAPMNVDGVPGIYRWSMDTQSYVQEDPAEGNQQPVAVDVPVITVIGTLGNLDEVCQTYPPVFIPEGNAFELPDPQAPDLPNVYTNAQWFLEITYPDESVERAIINRPAVPETDAGLYLYSVNLEASRSPVSVKLYRSPTGYPNIDVESAELVHTRVIGDPLDPAQPVLHVGRGEIANDELRLTYWCDPGYNCADRVAESIFPEAEQQISFQPTDDSSQSPLFCGTQGDTSTWTVPVVSTDGAPANIIVHAQRVLEAVPHTIVVPANDQTPWLTTPDMRQKLRVWIPYEENTGLAAGQYKTEGVFWVDVLKDGTVSQKLPIRIALTVHELSQITIPPNYTSDGLAIPEGDSASSLYYVFEDGNIGPSGSHWWGDATGNLVHVPVVDDESGEPATLVLRAHKIACGDWWGINTGQSADWGCTHKVHLQLEDGANTGLSSGHTYSSPGSHPVVIKGLRWHQPNAGQVLGVLALDISHTVP
jgi:hypothetical protein